MIKLENKMNFYFKNTKKDIIMTQENEEHFRNNNICWFCEKEILDNKVRDQTFGLDQSKIEIIVI